MRHPRIPLILAASALLACGDGEKAAPDPPESAPALQEPRRTPSGSRDAARVVILGTSLTAGMGLPDPATQSWAGRIQALADSAQVPVEVENAGASGDTSAGGLRRLEWLLQDPPDVLVIELGANDGLRGLGPDALEENLRTMVDRARAANPDVRIALAGMEAPTNLGPEYTEAFRAVFSTVARDLDLALVPFLLEGVAGVPELNQEDGIHPTPRGHARMARTAWPVLEPLLRTAAAAYQESGS